MATRTISNTGGNFNSTSTWVESAVPTSADTVVATSTSGQLTVNVASSAGALILTAYTNTLTMSSTLSVYGNITLGSGMTIAGSSSLNLVSSACTFTSNSKTWTTPITFPSISSTITLNGDLTVTGLITFPNVVTTTTINGSNLNINGSLTHNNGNTVQGTSQFIFGGTGTFTSNANDYYINNPLTINTTGATTFAGSVIYLGGNFAYSSGTVNVGTTNIAFKNNININPNGLSFNSIFFIAGGTITLLSDLIARGNTTLGTTASATLNGRNFYIGGNLFISNNVTIKGSTNFILNGTGTWSANATGIIQNNLNINTTGTTTIAGTVYYNTGTLSYSAGTVITTGSTLTLTAACILDVKGNSNPTATTVSSTGINFNNLTTTALGTHTVTGNIRVCGTHTAGGGRFNYGANIYNSGNYTVNTNTGAQLYNYIMDGTGTITTTGAIRHNLTFNTTGTITFTSLTFGGTANQVLTYVPNTGTINAGALIIGQLGFATTLDTNSLSFSTVQFQTNLITTTLNSTLNCTNCNFLIGATFAGTGGINADNFNCNVAGSIITLKNGVTYTVNSSLDLTGTAASPIQLKSSTASSYAFFNLVSGASCDVKFVTATDIDSSGGRLITDVKGTLLRTINWYKTNPDYFSFF